MIADIVKKFEGKVIFYTFDCSQKLNKKIITEKIHTCVSHVNIIDSLCFSFESLAQEKVFIFDEVDGYVDTDNISLTDISKLIHDLSIKAIFVSTNKGMSKLKDIAAESRTCRIGNYNINDIVAFVKKKFPDRDTDRVKDIVKEYGDDIRSLLNSLEMNVNSVNTKDDTQIDSDFLQKFQKIKKSPFIWALSLIEQDTTNYMLLVHENYNFLTSNTNDYATVLENLYYIDLFNNRMFEQQQWYLGEYSYSFLYASIKPLDFTKLKTLKIGTLWSKYSNWQYKRKLYNNFVYMRPNCIFHNFEFINGLKEYTMKQLGTLDKDDFKDCVDFLLQSPMEINKDDFEQLIRITTVSNNADVFKGSLKTKFLKELKT